MLAILKSRIFLGLIGLALLAVLLWFAGPYFAFADHKPLEGVVGRLIAILVLVAIWAIVMTLRQLRSSQASNKIAAEVVGQDGGRRVRGGLGFGRELEAGGSPYPGDVPCRRRRCGPVAASGLRTPSRRYKEIQAQGQREPVRIALVRDHRSAGGRGRDALSFASTSGFEFPVGAAVR